MLRSICGIFLVCFALAAPMESAVQRRGIAVKRAECPPGKGDKFWYCGQFKKYCENSKFTRYVKSNCPATCGLCEAAPTAAPTAQVVSVNPSDCLGAHNSKRSLHRDTPSLAWDASLAQGSQAWSVKLAKEHSDPVNLIHSSGSYGENLAYFGATGNGVKTCRDAVESWYNEIKDYNFDSPGFSMKTGHFTQVVWKSTTKVGCGIAKIKRGYWIRIFITCRYRPAGNSGSYRANVKRLA